MKSSRLMNKNDNSAISDMRKSLNNAILVPNLKSKKNTLNQKAIEVHKDRQLTITTRLDTVLNILSMAIPKACWVTYIKQGELI